MSINNKSRMDIIRTSRGFLYYLEKNGRIDGNKSREIGEVLLGKWLDLHDREDVKKQLLGILTSEEFDGLYGEYSDYYKTGFKKIKNCIVDLNEKYGIFPEGYSFLVNKLTELTLSDAIDDVDMYIKKYLEQLPTDGIKSIKSRIALIISVLESLSLTKRDLLRLDPDILFYSGDVNRIVSNISTLRQLGIDGVDNFNKLVYIISFCDSEDIKLKIGVLRELGIDGADNFSKLEVFFQNVDVDDIRSIITELRKIGIDGADNFSKLDNVLGFFDVGDIIKNIITLREDLGIDGADNFSKLESVIIGTPWIVKENILVLKDVGVTDVDELIELKDIVTSCLELGQQLDILKQWGVKLPSELKIFKLALLNGNIVTFKKYFGDMECGDVGELEMKVLSGVTLSKWLKFKEENHRKYLELIGNIVDTNYDYSKKNKIVEKIVTLSVEEAKDYLEIFKMFDNSISMDIQRIKNELIDEILKAEDPKKIAKEINNIFEKNNLPLTGKIFKVFELLYPKQKFKGTLEPEGSPVLHQYLDKGKDVYSLVYRDLMNIAIRSGDRSLRDYLKAFVGSEQLLKKFETIVGEEGFDRNDDLCLEGKLTEEEQAELLYLFRRIAVLYNRYIGKEINEEKSIEELKIGRSIVNDKALVKMYDGIKKGFNLRNGKSIYDRLQTLLYVNGLKYHSIKDVLQEMSKSKRLAHERGLKLFNDGSGGKISFPRQVFLKGVEEKVFPKIINRGVVCREYLGGGEDGKDGGRGGTGAGTDGTPFDIDGIYADSHTTWINYGNVNLVVDITRGNIYDTKKRGISGYTEDKFELFDTGVGDENRYGIRTGIPMTEVDYLVYYGSFESIEFERMCYEIVKNGYYIPITDEEGNIKFTPEMYHNIRVGFNYMDYYDGFDVELKDGKWVSKENDNGVCKEYKGNNKKINDRELIDLIGENSPTNEEYSEVAQKNRELAEKTIKWIKEILEGRCGIKFNSKYDSAIVGAEIYDSGSTGRGTDIPTNDVDLDFTLLLDAKDYERVEEIKKEIHAAIGTQEDDDHSDVEGWNQIKSKKNKIGGDGRKNGVPLDLLILKKSQVIDYSSSDAMKEKLNYIVNNSETGVEDLDFVRTNIIIMKKLLKAMRCYKKLEGGISGIGVENWITQHHGSFVEALESFEQVAYDGEYGPGKQPILLEEFQKRYPIYDAGENYKDGCNDNFVYKLNENGYRGTLEIVKVLRTKGIKGIRELIERYEVVKSQYINKEYS